MMNTNWGDGMMDGSFFGWGGMFFGPLMMIGFFALFIYIIVSLVRWLGGNNTSSSLQNGPSQTDALDILQQRFAAGEIDEPEYNAKRRALMS